MRGFLATLLEAIRAASREELESRLEQARRQEDDPDPGIRRWAMVRVGALEEALEGHDVVRYLREIDSIITEVEADAGKTLIEETSAFLKDQHGPA